MDIEEFYEADERRRRSEEVEIGTEWHDDAGVRYEVSWVADTGELYVMGEPNAPVALDLFGDVYESSGAHQCRDRGRGGLDRRPGPDGAGARGVADGHDRSPTASRGWPSVCASSPCPARPRADRSRSSVRRSTGGHRH